MPSSLSSRATQPIIHDHHPLPSSHATVYNTTPVPPLALQSSLLFTTSTPSSMTSRRTPERGEGIDGRGRRKPVPDLRPIDVGKAQRVAKTSGTIVFSGPSPASSSTSTICLDTPTIQRSYGSSKGNNTHMLSPLILAALPSIRPAIKKKPPPPPPPPPSTSSPALASLEPTHRYASWIEQGHRPNTTRRSREMLPFQDGTVLHNILMTPSWGLSSTSVDQPPRPSTSYSHDRLVTPPPKPRRDNRDSLFDRASDMLTTRRLRLINKQQVKERPVVGGSGYCAPLPVEMGKTGRRQVDLGDMEEYRRKYGTDEEGGSIGWRRKDGDKEKSGRKGSVMRFLFTRSRKQKARKEQKDEEKMVRQRKRRVVLIAIASIILVAIIVIAVCVSLFANTKSHVASAASPSDSNSTTTTSPSSTVTASPIGPTAYTLASCLSLFALSAPTSPFTYPCDTCSPLLSSTSNDFVSGGGGNATGVGAALQFCALRDIYTATGVSSSINTGTATSSSISPSASVFSGWLSSGTNVCSNWNGVTCDAQGRVTGLSLVYPAVPSQLAPSLGNLVALKSLKIVGNTAIPFGTIPSTVFSAANLSSITIQSTSLTSIPSNALSSLANLLSLALVSNAKLGSALPSLNENKKLLTVVVTGQSLTGDPFSTLPTSLTYLDLSFNSLSGAIPDLTRLTALSSLFLDSNAFTILPLSFPSFLQDFSIQSNPSLGGILPTSLCTSVVLSACDLRGTSLSASNKHNTTSTVVATRTTKSGSSTLVSTQTSVVATIATAASCGSCVFA